MNITIKPQTIRMIRESQEMTRAALAESSRVSERQIARIEDAKEETLKVRENTVLRLAGALRTSPAVLKGEAEWFSKNRPRDGGKTKMKLDPGLQIDFDLVQHHYGVTEKELVALAPTLFTLMAEACIVWHRKRQKEFESQIRNLKETMPHDSDSMFGENDGSALSTMFWGANRVNLAGVTEKNLRGGEEEYTDGYLSNAMPFGVYLFYFLEKIIKDAIEAGEEVKEMDGSKVIMDDGIIRTILSDEFVEWKGIIHSERLENFSCPKKDISDVGIGIFDSLFNKIIGGRPNLPHTYDEDEGFLGTAEQRDAFLAQKALWGGHARITEIPEDLFAPDKTKERVEWLIGKLPEDHDDKWLAERKTWQSKTGEVAEK